MKKNKNILIIGILAVVVFGVTFGVTFGIITLTQNIGKNKNQISEEKALADLETLYNKISVNTLSPVMGDVDLSELDVAGNLPDIEDDYPPVVQAHTSDAIEIFSSTEKATVSTDKKNDNDRWLVDMAEAFNSSGATVDGRPVSVTIRGVPSGYGMDYISTGVYIPDAFSPSNELWGDDLAANGIDLTKVEDSLIGNVAGIVLTKEKFDEIQSAYGSVSLKSVTEAVAAGELVMGYTNPFASSTGANFLMSTLYTFDPRDPFSDEAVAAFESFQSNVPFVAFTTLQMKEAAKSGTLDGFVFEYQQFVNSPDLRTGYEFIPFGVRHDSPVYAMGQLSDTKQAILNQFIDFCKSSESQDAAAKLGFNGHGEYSTEIDGIDGEGLSQAQKLWKEKKTGSREIIAVFVADISGSMDNNNRMNMMRTSLLEGAKVIGNNCSVGLVTYSTEVNIALPIAKFDLNQQALFTGAVEDMQSGGQTAMFDAIIVGQKMLMDAKADNPNAILKLFVLTDGETNVGATLKNTRSVIEGLQIPITTIGYDADIDALATVSAINEAAAITATPDNVKDILPRLFNAEM